MLDKTPYRWLQLKKNPLGVVNFCFIVVLLFSTLLMWREAVVLEGAYATSQRNQLNSIATSLDRQLQHNIDELLFFRNAMQSALADPGHQLLSGHLVEDMQRLRSFSHWQLFRRINQRHPLPINGVSDAFIGSYPLLLLRDDDDLQREMSAVLDFSYILKLAGGHQQLKHQLQYTSRAGYFVSEQEVANDASIAKRYQQLIERPYFIHHNDRENPQRGLIWSYFSEAGIDNRPEKIISVSVPVDYERRWYGVLSIDFPRHCMHQFLKDAMDNTENGAVILYNPNFDVIAASSPEMQEKSLFTADQKVDLQAAMQRSNEGEMRMTTHFITWSKLHSYDGVLVRLHTLREGIAGEYGSITIVLALLWMVSTLMLVGSWYAIRLMMKRMMNMQRKLRWRANYDGLTRVYSRGAFFEQAHHRARECREEEQPYSIIQLDLDHFKQINDTWGHEAGDRVLAHAGSILLGTLREQDIAGRVGGEEFCILLPGTGLADATRVAERLRARLNAQEILVSQDQTLRIQASFGVSSSEEQQDYAVDHLQSVADGRLYRAKKAGRNQVCWQ